MRGICVVKAIFDPLVAQGLILRQLCVELDHLLLGRLTNAKVDVLSLGAKNRAIDVPVIVGGSVSENEYRGGISWCIR